MSSSQTTKQKDVRTSNILSAVAVADLIRTSLGPRGMDKMIIDAKEQVTISNDGATIMSNLELQHPAARMLIDLSKAQDVEAGDGTTSVVVLAGSLLRAAHRLLEKGLHAAKIFEGFGIAWRRATEIMEDLALPVDLNDHSILEQNATTSLSSKVVSHSADILAPLAVKAVTSVVDPSIADNVDLNNIRVVCKVGGTIEDTRLVEGLVFPQGAIRASGSPTRVENAKIGLIQFCLSAPKSDMESTIIVSEYEQMDRVLREERKYVLSLIKTIKKSGCNVLLIQKSILRDAVGDLALHYLGKLGILAIKDIERSEIDFISRSTGALPVASIEGFTSDKLGHAQLVEQLSTPGGKIVEVTGCSLAKNPTISVLVRGSNNLVVAEAERSIHDALCVVRSLVKRKALLVGGGAAEVECAQRLNSMARTESGLVGHCLRAFADALEVIPITLAENAGLNAIQTLTALRKAHSDGQRFAGVDVRRGKVSDMQELEVLQPLLVNTSALSLAVEYVRMLLKIDDIVSCR
ncbi:hypothetical protein P9112_008544 [Eukaryota sp. TZLM1-RC]